MNARRRFGQKNVTARAHFVAGGQACDVVHVGSAWKAGEGWLEGSGMGNYLHASRLLGKGDFSITARFSPDGVERHRGLAHLRRQSLRVRRTRGKRCSSRGRTLARLACSGPNGDYLKPGQPVVAQVVRRGTNLTFRLAGEEILTVPFKTESVGLVGLRPWRSTMRVYDFSANGNLVVDRAAVLNLRLKLRDAKQVDVNGVRVDLGSPPRGMVVRRELGLLTTPAVRGQVIHKEGDIVWVPRATITPKGDYLVLFPSDRGEWYQGKEMLASRSTDKGHTWSEATVAFDATQSHHGFVPLVPRGSKRIYAFGTQAIPGLVGDRKQGLHENAPIGYRYSDDDGHSWTPVTLLKPVNDREFRGMSCVRMCETTAGAWLIGSHDGIWSVPRDPKQHRDHTAIRPA